MEVNRQEGGEIVLWDVGMPEKLIRAEDFFKGSCSLHRWGWDAAWQKEDDQSHPEHCYQGHVGLIHPDITESVIWLMRRVCVEE